MGGIVPARFDDVQHYMETLMQLRSNSSKFSWADGVYTFQLGCDDRGSLRIDGKQVAVVSQWNVPQSSPPIRLRAGRPVPIEVRMEEDAQGATASLRWQPPGKRQMEKIPASALRPGSLEVVQVKDPRGETFLAELSQDDSGTSLKISRSLFPGLYECKPSEGGSFPAVLAPCIAADGTLKFSVRAGTEESTMLAISQEQADRLRRFVSLSLATKIEDVQSILRGSAFGKEIWRLFAIAVLFFLVAEIALSRWISIQRREGQETDVDFTNEGEMGKASFKDALKKLKGR